MKNIVRKRCSRNRNAFNALNRTSKRYNRQIKSETVVREQLNGRVSIYNEVVVVTRNHLPMKSDYRY